MNGWLLLAVSGLLVGGCSTMPPDASDAPEATHVRNQAFVAAASHGEALARWRTAEDVNAWIGARFEYDRARAMLLSETQRQKSARLPIHAPAAFFESPRGVCVDLTRFAVETLRAIEPAARPAFVMIEFEPVTVGGNTLRLHWLASFRRGEDYYFFADSKRPGHIAGPYASPAAFMAEYEAYRGRKVVAYRELPSYERTTRARAARQDRSTSR